MSPPKPLVLVAAGAGRGDPQGRLPHPTPAPPASARGGISELLASQETLQFPRTGVFKKEKKTFRQNVPRQPRYRRPLRQLARGRDLHLQTGQEMLMEVREKSSPTTTSSMVLAPGAGQEVRAGSG